MGFMGNSTSVQTPDFLQNNYSPRRKTHSPKRRRAFQPNEGQGKTQLLDGEISQYVRRHRDRRRRLPTDYISAAGSRPSHGDVLRLCSLLCDTNMTIGPSMLDRGED